MNVFLCLDNIICSNNFSIDFFLNYRIDTSLVNKVNNACRFYYPSIIYSF